MSVKLHKEHIKINEVLCAKYGQTTVESDVIVPDINPDVLKVLRISQRAYITQKTVQQDRAYVQGVIKLNILYIPETFECGRIKSINYNLDFSQVVEAKGAKPGMCITAEAECENISDNLVNSRKLNIKCTVGINVKICVCSEKEIATSAEDESCLELKKSSLKILNSTTDTDKEFVVSEKLSLPSGKPKIGEVLKLGASASSSELRFTDGKAVVKGELKLSLLYSSRITEDQDSTIEFSEYTLPFTEVFDVSGVKEDMEGEIDYHIKEINHHIEDAEDENSSCLSCDVTVGAYIRGTELYDVAVIEDAFSTTSNINIEKKAYDIEVLLDKAYVQIPLKELLEVPDYLPEIQKVCDISAIPSVTDVCINGSLATVKGIISVNMLYITRSSELPVAGFDKIFEFSHCFELSDICEDSMCEAKVNLEHLSYTLSSDRCIELRLINSLSVKCMCSDKTEIIDSIEEDEKPIRSLPSVIIYFVQPGDTLWNIAKRFHTSVEKIVEDNNLASDVLKIGQRLMIFK